MAAAEKIIHEFLATTVVRRHAVRERRGNAAVHEGVKMGLGMSGSRCVFGYAVCPLIHSVQPASGCDQVGELVQQRACGCGCLGVIVCLATAYAQ